MGFFDLNIPYGEPSTKSSRIKIVTKLMELGYSGIAYNRSIKGVMSDHDRCSISRLTLSSLLKLVPSFSSAVEFHRDLLGVPRSSPFRQYTRLTISLDTPSEILAVNSGNLILKSYDLVAVKPLNQHAFDQACEKLEIDIIAIDFAEKLPFRLKNSMVKSAIQRGVYFEITYSNLIADVHERRQVISNAKLLVDWTRGKNLIFSSGASFVNEIRGPYDVANLSSLIGLSMERAKDAISKNCRTLVANALRKKKFYKETIKVERISSNDQFDPNEPWSVDTFKWDPISSGEGDLLLDDIAKSFAASSKESKLVKAINFASVIDNMPPQGFQVKDVLSGCEGDLPLDEIAKSFAASSKESKFVKAINFTSVIDSMPPQDCCEGDLLLDEIAKSSAASRKESKLVKAIDFASVIDSMPPQGFQVNDVISGCEAKLLLDNDTDLLHIADDIEPPIAENVVIQQSHLSHEEHCSLSNHQCNVVESLKDLNSHSDAGKDSRNSEEVKTTVEKITQPKISLQEKPTEMDIDDVQSQNLLSGSEVNIITNEIVCSTTSTRDLSAICDNDGIEKSLKMSEDVDSFQNEYVLKSSDIFSGSENVSGDKSLTNLVSENQEKMMPLARDETSTAAKCLLGVRFTEPGDASISEDQSFVRSSPMSNVNGDFLISIPQVTSEELMEEQKCGEADTQIRHPPSDHSMSGVMSTGKYRAKRSRNRSASFLPFKRLINPLTFKKKVRNPKRHQ